MNTTAIASSGLLLALTASPALAQGSGLQTLEGEHFQVQAEFDPPELLQSIGQEILDTAESTWDAEVELYGLKNVSLQAPWIIHAYRFVNQFEDMDSDLNDGIAKEDKQYLFQVEGTREIHLGLFPWTTDAVISEYGLPLQCLRTLIGHLTGIIRSEITAAPMLYPPWFTEGLDLLISERILTQKKRMPLDASEDPNMATYFTQVKGLNQQTRLPEPLDLILGKTANLEDRQGGLGYVWARWVLAGKQKKRLHKLISGMLALSVDDGFADQFEKIAKKNFKRGPLKNLDRNFKKYLRTVSPKWRYEFSESQIMGDKILQIADEEAAASCISNQRPSKPVYKIAGKVTILKDWATHQANLVVGKMGQKDFLLVSMSWSEQSKAVYLYHFANDEWTTVKEVPSDEIVVGKPMDFQFEMRKQRHMAFTLNGKEIFDFKFERAMTSNWGLQAQAGGSVLWEGVKLLSK